MASNRDTSDQFFKMSVELSNQMKVQFRGASAEELKTVLGGYLNMLHQPIPEVKEGEDMPTVEVACDILHQLCLLSSAPLARLVAERYRGKHA